MIGKILILLALLACATVLVLFVAYEPQNIMALGNGGIRIIDARGNDNGILILSSSDKQMIITALGNTYCYLPFEKCRFTLSSTRTAANPEVAVDYSDILYGTYNITTPFDFFHHDPFIADRGSLILARDKRTNAWKLVEKACCCEACARWF